MRLQIGRLQVAVSGTTPANQRLYDAAWNWMKKAALGQVTMPRAEGFSADELLAVIPGTGRGGYYDKANLYNRLKKWEEEKKVTKTPGHPNYHRLSDLVVNELKDELELAGKDPLSAQPVLRDGPSEPDHTEHQLALLDRCVQRLSSGVPFTHEDWLVTKFVGKALGLGGFLDD